MSLFSPLLADEFETKFRKHCPIKGLGAKSRVIYEDFPGPADGRSPPESAGGTVKHQDMMNSRMGVAARISMITALGLGGAMLTLPAWSQKFPNLPITPEQTATAQKVAQAGVPLGELMPNAPDTYVVKARDTLWDISKMYLKSPWRWPELWGMNMEQIRNPHLIYPGQTLYLVKRDGRALLTGTPPATEGAPAPAADSDTGNTAEAAGTGDGDRGTTSGTETVRLSPRIRSEGTRNPLTTLQTSTIEPFLAEPLVVEEREMLAAPRIVAAADNRVVIGQSDRVYARGPASTPLMDDQPQYKQYRIFRNAKALKDPDSGEVLGYEAEFLGKATLARSEGVTEVRNSDGVAVPVAVPATIDITQAKSEILVGDRLVPEPEREYLSFAPRAPTSAFSGRVVAIYGSSSVANAAQNQVVVLNRGKRDGIESGHVLALLKDGRQIEDRTDEKRLQIKLPNERNGLLMVFRTFDKVSYGLILTITDTVRVGDRLVSPQQ